MRHRDEQLTTERAQQVPLHVICFRIMDHHHRNHYGCQQVCNCQRDNVDIAASLHSVFDADDVDNEHVAKSAKQEDETVKTVQGYL